tara:strand:+ start:70 stop:972 length:903 start_codon:yes stop_codon:yes gene_type:complete
LFDKNSPLFRYLILLLKLLSLFLFIYLISKADWKSCLNDFKELNILFVISTIVVIYLGYLLKSLRWKIILRSFEINENSGFLLKIFLIGGFLGIITPGKIGDFGRVYYLKKHKNWKKAFSSLIIDRLNDLTILFLFGLLSLYHFQNKFPEKFDLKFNSNSVLVMSAGIILALIIIIKFKNKLGEFFEIIKNSSTISGYLIQLTVSSLAITLLYSSFVIISNNLGVDIPALDILLIAFVTGILNLLPITILGIGVREVAIVYLFGLYGVEFDKAISFSLIIFAIQIITLLPGGYWFYKNPI